MKRLLLLLAMGLIVINVTTGCNKAEDGGTSMVATNSPATNATSTPAPGH